MVYSKLGFFEFNIPVSIEIDSTSITIRGDDNSATLIMGRSDVLCVAHYKKSYAIELYDDIWLMDVNTFITKKYNLLSDMMTDIIEKL